MLVQRCECYQETAQQVGDSQKKIPGGAWGGQRFCMSCPRSERGENDHIVNKDKTCPGDAT